MMNLIATLAFSLLASAQASMFGTMFISKVDGKPTPRHLFIGSRNTLVVNKWPSTFEYEREGSLKKCNTDKYVGIDDAGSLVMMDTPTLGFKLSLVKGSQHVARLLYDGSRVFYLCGDDSLNYWGSCDGARRVFVTFEDLFQ